MKKISFSVLLTISVFFFSCTPEVKQEALNKDFSGNLTQEEINNGILTPEILWKFGRIGEQKLSPDGENLVYTVTRYDYLTNESITDIFLVSSIGDEPIKLTNSNGSYFNPRWTATGDKIGFLSNESGSSQLWEMNTDGTSKKQISHVEGGINGFEYSPDGSKVFYLKDVKFKKTPKEIYPDLPLANVRIIDDLMYRHWNNWEDEFRSHIFVAGYEQGKLSNSYDILEGEPWDAPLSPYFDQSEIKWSPDGQFIAYTCKKMKGRDYAVSTNSDIYLFNVNDKTTENLTKGMSGYDKYPSFSPDGSKIAWQSMKTPGFESDKDRLFVMDLKSGEKQYLTSDFDQSVSNLVWAEDNHSIYFISGNQATYQLYKINTLSKEISQITKGIHDYTGFELSKGIITASKMSMSMATELFNVNPETGEETQISDINSNIYDDITMGEVKSRWVKTTDGKQMLVWVIYPPNFDPEKKYPALLYCQGGPQSAVSQFFSFRWNFQIMAANDYIIVAPNRRGLPTFGQAWNDQISGDYGGQNMKDYLSAIDDVKKESYVDENRLGAVGASYGGYSVFYLAGHHEGRFKAFISHCGIYNLESMYTETEETFFVNHDNEGAYWEKPKPKSYQYSPHLFVDKWDTPILIITGEYDFRIPYTQSMQAFNAAQLRGVPSKLLIFPDETHFVTKPQNSILWQREFFGWLDKYLK
jgi:dipeptidyl aminopeptidase/acylaminoacyl peptidase